MVHIDNVFYAWEFVMKQSRCLLLFSLTVGGFALVECLLTALLSPYVAESLFLSRSFPYLARLLAVIPPFLAFGAAVEAIRVRGLGYSLIFLGIYAGISLFFQIPLSLIDYSEFYSAPYVLLLLSYMLSAAVTALLFLFALLLGYALFMQNDLSTEDTPLFSLKGHDARALFLASGLLTLYHIIREIIDVTLYLRDKMYIITGEDVLSILFSFCFFLALGVFCFLVGRTSGRLFQALPPEEISDEDDYI